jgi:amino acid permease
MYTYSFRIFNTLKKHDFFVCIHVFSFFKNIAKYGTKLQETQYERELYVLVTLLSIFYCFFIEHILLARCLGV